MSGILHSLRKYWVFRNPGWLSKVSRSVDSMLPKLFEKMLKGKDLGDYIAAAGKPGAGGSGGRGGGGEEGRGRRGRRGGHGFRSLRLSERPFSTTRHCLVVWETLWLID